MARPFGLEYESGKTSMPRMSTLVCVLNLKLYFTLDHLGSEHDFS
jgi:hypothetical protein